nr:MAG TPA: hypothetical protein [Caudoviricetes sp.]
MLWAVPQRRAPPGGPPPGPPPRRGSRGRLGWSARTARPRRRAARSRSPGCRPAACATPGGPRRPPPAAAAPGRSRPRPAPARRCRRSGATGRGSPGGP